MKKKQKYTWLKRLGIGGFIFFLIKGILWVLIGLGLINQCS
tara:strand:- start:198 stop:320 length:123 start_codon:yes stop_codon:yes gene_type:complete